MTTQKHINRAADFLTTLVIGAIFFGSISAQAFAQEASPDAKIPPAQMAGTWKGDIADTFDGSGTATLNLTQVKSTVGGTFSTDFGGSENPLGTAKGHVAGDKATITLTVTNSNHPCKVKLTGNVVSTDEYTGTYRAIIDHKHCKASGGTFDVFLQ